MRLAVPWNPPRRRGDAAERAAAPSAPRFRVPAVVAGLVVLLSGWSLGQTRPVDPFATVAPVPHSEPGSPALGAGPSGPRKATPFATDAGSGPTPLVTGRGPSPVATSSAPAPAVAGPPVSRPLDVHNGSVTLSGTLLVPSGPGPFPAVVLLPGRGASSRDQAAADARLFATHGIAAYAYDKRGTGSSTGDWRSTIALNDQVGDAVAAVAAVRRQPGIDPSRVGVWGVGQGAWLAPFVGEHADVAFLILLNTNAAPLGQEEVWHAGDAVRARGYSPTAADTAMRGVRLLVSTRPVLAALLPHGQLGFLKDNPSSTPADALRRERAPALLVYDDLNPHAAGVKTTAQLLRAAQNRDQPLDHVTVLGRQGAGTDGAGTGGNPGAALANARRAADPAYRSVVVGWTRTVLATLAPSRGAAVPLAAATGAPFVLPAATGGTGPVVSAGGSTTATGPAADPTLLLPGTSDRPSPWYASPWVQLGAVVFFLIAFGEGLVVSVLPLGRRSPGASWGAGAERAPSDDVAAARAASRAAQLLRLAQALVSLVDLALLAGTAVAIAFLLGLYRPAGLALTPLAHSLRALSAVSGVLAVALALLVLASRRSAARPPRTAIAVVVAVAAALFLPFLVYWHVPFLAG